MRPTPSVPSLVALAAVAMTLSLGAGEEITVEGTVSPGFCGMLPAIPVCVVTADSDGKSYAFDSNGDGSLNLSDGIWCLTMLHSDCRHRARVRGPLGMLQCDPIEPFGMPAIFPSEVVMLPVVLECGDVNGSGTVDIADAIRLLEYLFVSSEGRPLCRGTTDVNGDGALDISDPVFLLTHLFAGGPALRCP